MTDPPAEVPCDDLDYDDTHTYVLDGAAFTGRCFDTWPDGARCWEQEVVDGGFHGRTRRWHENGTLAEESALHHGALHGLARSFDSAGRPTATATYEFGIRTTATRFAPDGTVVETFELRPGDPGWSTLEIYRRFAPPG